MTSKKVSSVVGALIALLIISTLLGVSYFNQLGEETQSKNQYVGELKAANDNYNQLASQYNSALTLYNETFSLLVRAISVVNTSQPVYQQASSELSRLWNSYLKLRPVTSSLYSANILFDFGNGTRRWYNNTQVQPGWNLFTETVVLTNGNLQAPLYYIPGSGWEHFVSGIEGVSNSKSVFWWLWTYNKTAGWQTAPVGADLLPVYNGSRFAWTYCGSTPDFMPTCKP